jgi:putative flavoprotein involved in K+ transport
LQVLHSSEWRGPASLRGPRLLIVGGATAAIEIAEECARAGLRPVLSVRGRDVKIAPQRFLGRDLHDFVTVLFAWLPRKLARAYCDGRQSLPGTDLGFRDLRRRGVITVRGAMSRVEGKSVLFADGARAEFDALVCATGHRYDVPFLPPEVERAPRSGQPLADRCESRSWPGLYVVGMPCVRRLASEFLYGIAADAPRVAHCLA